MPKPSRKLAHFEAVFGLGISCKQSIHEDKNDQIERDVSSNAVYIYIYIYYFD